MVNDDDIKRGIAEWSNRLHIPVTRMMGRLLREEIQAACERREAGNPNPKRDTPKAKQLARDILRNG